ncbi:MAG TPA: hypothetical protein VMT15_16435 [Bryobacteraceae bacterium]|nr:hypothetical protein [Bryobacteraceae bacterium]
MLKNFSQGEGSRTQLVLRVLVGVLLVLNLAAAGLLLYPPGGSADQLERELADLQGQAKAKREVLEKTKQHVAAVELGRSEGDKFLDAYFLSSRARSEQLLSQLGKAASGSKIREKDRSIAFEPIDGSDILSMMSITANYEGEYSDLLHFVHEIDRSPSLMIIESLNAAPQTGSKLLSISMRIDTFVREDSVQ